MHPLFPNMTRRQALQTAACGFGSLAMAGLAAEIAAGTNPLAAKAPHLAPKAKRIIFLFMQGGVSQVDSFDYKPAARTRRRQDDAVRRRPRPRQHRQCGLRRIAS